jgi:hypothetical protein
VDERLLLWLLLGGLTLALLGFAFLVSLVLDQLERRLR